MSVGKQIAAWMEQGSLDEETAAIRDLMMKKPMEVAPKTNITSLRESQRNRICIAILENYLFRACGRRNDGSMPDLGAFKENMAKQIRLGNFQTNVWIMLDILDKGPDGFDAVS